MFAEKKRSILKYRNESFGYRTIIHNYVEGREENKEGAEEALLQEIRKHSLGNETDIPFLYCSCGYAGIPFDKKSIGGRKSPKKAEVFLYHPVSLAQSWSQNEGREFSEEVDYGCPECQTTPEVILSRFRKPNQGFLDGFYVERYEKNHPKKSIWSFVWQSTYYEMSEEKPAETRSVQMRISVDLQTGKTYILQEGKENNRIDISMGMKDGEWIRKELSVLGSCVKATQELHDFFHQCLCERGVIYRTIDSIIWDKLDDGNMADVLERNVLLKVLPFIRYPQLQHLEVKNWCYPPSETEEKMERMGKTKRSMIEALTTHKSKSVLEAVDNLYNLQTAMLFGPFIQDVNNLRKLFTRDQKDQDDLHISPIYPIDSDEYTLTLKGVSLVREHFGENEEGFVRAIIKLSNYFYDESMWKNSLPPIAISDVCQTFEDFMYECEAIKRKKPDYEIPFHKDIKKMHDVVGKDYLRLRKENQVISYTSEELACFEHEVDGYTFVLAKDTYQLIDAGSDMDICVGSYGEKTVTKESTIVFAYNEEGERCICIEVKQRQGMQKMMYISQAKTHRNASLNQQETAIVAKWCMLGGIEELR